MKFNVEKFKMLARVMTDEERQDIEFRDNNRDWLSLSAKFALSVRHLLRKEGLTQRQLAARLNVSPAQITKILSGKENLSLQTIVKIEKALGHSFIRIIDIKENSLTSSESIFSNRVGQYPSSIPIVDYASDFFDDTYSSSSGH